MYSLISFVIPGQKTITHTCFLFFIPKCDEWMQLRMFFRKFLWMTKWSPFIMISSTTVSSCLTFQNRVSIAGRFLLQDGQSFWIAWASSANWGSDFVSCFRLLNLALLIGRREMIEWTYNSISFSIFLLSLGRFSHNRASATGISLPGQNAIMRLYGWILMVESVVLVMTLILGNLGLLAGVCGQRWMWIFDCIDTGGNLHYQKV